MKFRVFAIFFAAMLLLTACGSAQAENRIDAAEDAVENQLETIKDAVEHQVDGAEEAVNQALPPATAQPSPTEAAATITKEEAQSIALEHAGLTADQVTYLRTEYEIDDGVPQYEVEFHHDRWEYDYEIHAETGDVLSYDRDD